MMRALRSIFLGLFLVALASAHVDAATSAGTLSIAASSYSVARTAGSVTVGVKRSGGSTGTASVAYATTNGSAKAGIDYTTKTGVLTWANGDASTKTLKILISSSGTGGKTFSFWIVGASGTLSSPTRVNVTITGSTSSSSSSSSSSKSSSSSSASSVSSSSSKSSSSSSVSSVSSSSSSSAGAAGISFPGGSKVQSGTPATLGNPSSTAFDGLIAVLDKSAHTPKHAVDGAAGAMPTALASSLPYIPTVKVLARADAVLLYFPNVAGAADYRAYAVNNTVSFVDSANGKQPRGAVIGCAGFREHFYESSLTSSGQHTRELMQAVEIPGFVNSGNYTIVLEALKTPCPFTGMPGHTDANITSTFPADGVTYINTNLHAALRSFATVKALYGNEILNGQGSLTSWTSRYTQAVGLPVPADSTVIPKDPVVLARSAIAVQMPFFDESVNAPIFDVGSNAVFDDFSDNLVVASTSMGINPDYSANAALAPYATIPGAWTFWGRYMQHADKEETTLDATGVARYTTSGYHGFQIFQRHGRLYTTFGDGGQDIGGTMSFASLKTLPLAIDNTKYAHSFWRVNSDASHRRYWTWSICGAATRGELVNTTTHAPLIRPIITESAATPQGDNPTARMGDKQAALSPKECLTIIQDGRPEAPRSDGNERASSRITVQIHPAGVAKGIIALGNTATDSPAPNGATSLGFRYKTDAAGKYAGPLIEPFDQQSPLPHYDVFLNRTRLVFFVNGRQGFCIDLSGRPLTMNYGMVSYGDLIYHSALEWQEVANDKAALYQHQLNAPIASSRVWDAIGEADLIAIPTQFATLDLTQCRKPATLAIQ